MATDRPSNVAVSKGGHHYHESHEGGELLVSHAGDHGHGRGHWSVHDRGGWQGPTVVTSVGELLLIIYVSQESLMMWWYDCLHDRPV